MTTPQERGLSQVEQRAKALEALERTRHTDIQKSVLAGLAASELRKEGVDDSVISSVFNVKKADIFANIQTAKFAPKETQDKFTKAYLGIKDETKPVEVAPERKHTKNGQSNVNNVNQFRLGRPGLPLKNVQPTNSQSFPPAPAANTYAAQLATAREQLQRSAPRPVTQTKPAEPAPTAPVVSFPEATALRTPVPTPEPEPVRAVVGVVYEAPKEKPAVISQARELTPVVETTLPSWVNRARYLKGKGYDNGVISLLCGQPLPEIQAKLKTATDQPHRLQAISDDAIAKDLAGNRDIKTLFQILDHNQLVRSGKLKARIRSASPQLQANIRRYIAGLPITVESAPHTERVRVVKLAERMVLNEANLRLKYPSSTTKNGLGMSDLAIAIQIMLAIKAAPAVAPIISVIAQECGTTNRGRVAAIYDDMATTFGLPPRLGNKGSRKFLGDITSLNRFTSDQGGRALMELTESGVIQVFSRLQTRGAVTRVSDQSIALHIARLLGPDCKNAPGIKRVANECGTKDVQRIYRIYDYMATVFRMPERNKLSANKGRGLTVDQKIAQVRQNPYSRFPGRPNLKVEAVRQELLQQIALNPSPSGQVTFAGK